VPAAGYVDSLPTTRPSWSAAYVPRYRLRMVVTLDNSHAAAAAAGGLPQTATIILPDTSTAAVSWPYALPTDAGETISTYSLRVESFGCDMVSTDPELPACQADLAAAWIPPTSLYRWQWRPASVVTTLAGPGGCATTGTRDGYQRPDAQLYGDDLPLIGSTIIRLRASGDLVYLQDRTFAGIRVFDRRTRTLSAVAGNPASSSSVVVHGVSGADARFDFRQGTNAGMEWDRTSRYLYVPTLQNQAVARVDLQNSGFTEVVYGASHTACKCLYPITCPASCYTESDAACGLDALVNEVDSVGLSVDPRGRYFYIVDAMRLSLRRVDTQTFCPTTLMLNVSARISTLFPHPSGDWLLAYASGVGTGNPAWLVSNGRANWRADQHHRHQSVLFVVHFARARWQRRVLPVRAHSGQCVVSRHDPLPAREHGGAADTAAMGRAH